MANLFYKKRQKMTVLSKNTLAKMSEKPLISAKIMVKTKKKGLHFPSASNP